MSFVLATCLGLLMRAFGRRPVRKTFGKRAATFWQDAEQVDDPNRYYRQFRTCLMSENKKKTFAQAQQEKQAGIIKEFFLFLRYNKKYWMIPIVITLLALAVLVLLGGTAIAPFIYTLF